jgi:transcriptional regulator with XRE-family HTH domain
MKWIDNIKQIMKDKGVNIEVLRGLILKHGGNLSRNSISNILNGRNSPKIETLQLLASALGVPLSDFFIDSSGEISGLIEYRNKLYRIASVKDLNDITAMVNESQI